MAHHATLPRREAFDLIKDVQIPFFPSLATGAEGAVTVRVRSAKK